MLHLPLIAWLFLDPPPVAFTIPFIDRPVTWYGICFVTGFIFGYFILLPMFRTFLWQKRYGHSIFDDEKFRTKTEIHVRDLSVLYVDRLTWFIAIGTVIGARLGHVVFYDFHYYLNHPEDIIKTWEGGLASHGGTIGVLVSLFLFLYVHRSKIPELSFVSLADLVCVPTALVACCIRIGNIFNQEILGYPSHLPWAVIFGHPADGSPALPRHPVQIYETAAYLLTFLILYFLWKFRSQSLKVGTLSGLFFVCVFGSRFVIEFFKLPQSHLIDESFLQMGQYLSIPFIILGFFLIGATSFFLKENSYHDPKADTSRL